MPDVTLPSYRGRLSRGRRESTSAAPSSSHAQRLRPAPARDVAQRGLGLPGHDPAAGRARHPVDRHRRGDPLLLDPRHGRPRQPGPRPPPRPALPALAVREGGSELSIVFRDHSMSDQVGFHYQRSPGPVAAGDFLGKVHAIGDACRHNPATLVPVILDGENCWEYYPDGGVSFLRSLYQEAVRDPQGPPGHASASSSREHPPAVDTVPRLFAGSWISHNFAIWIGHPEDNRAWDALARDPRVPGRRGGHRPSRRRRRSRGPGTRSTSPRAPTGSGGTATTTPAPWTPCSTTSSASTCGTSTRCWAATRPGSLFTPISRAAPHPPLHDQPVSFLHVKVDGRAPYFEWINAARYACGNDRGTMALVARGVLRTVWFGFDADRLLIRVDTEGGPARRAAGRGRPAPDRLRRPGRDGDRGRWSPPPPRPVAYLNQRRLRRRATATTVEVATGTVLELAVPFAPARPERRATRSGSTSSCSRGDASLDRAPREGIFELTVPSPDFETDHVASVTTDTRITRIDSHSNRELLDPWSSVSSVVSCVQPSDQSPPASRRPNHARAAKRPDRRPLGDHRARAGQAAARLQRRSRRSRSRPGLCPFCEGHEDKTPPEILAYRELGSRPNGPGWRIRVVPNRSPR